MAVTFVPTCTGVNLSRFRAITQLAIAAITHRPQAGIGFKKKTMVSPGGNRDHIVGFDLHPGIPFHHRTIAQLAMLIVTHRPQAAVRPDKKAVQISSRQRGDSVRNKVGGLNLSGLS